MAQKEEKLVQQEPTKEAKPQETGFSRISPSAKLLLTEHGLDASSITASGPRGTLLKGDVLAALKSGKGSAKISESKETKPPSKQSQPQTPVSALSELRSDLQQADAFEDLPNSQIRKVNFFDIKWHAKGVYAILSQLSSRYFLGFVYHEL